jgi:hypothetical protein
MFAIIIINITRLKNKLKFTFYSIWLYSHFYIESSYSRFKKNID